MIVETNDYYDDCICTKCKNFRITRESKCISCSRKVMLFSNFELKNKNELINDYRIIDKNIYEKTNGKGNQNE